MACIFYNMPYVILHGAQQGENNSSDAIFKGIPNKGNTNLK